MSIPISSDVDPRAPAGETRPGRVRVLCIDDHPMIRDGVAALLASDPSLELVGEADRIGQAIPLLQALKPEVVITELVLADGSALEILAAARRFDGEVRVVVLTDLAGDLAARRALAAGADGYVLKSRPGSDILAAIHAVRAGRRAVDIDVNRRLDAHAHDIDLSERETQVLRLVSQGLANKEIAKRLSLTEGTVKNYLAQVLAKLGALDRTHAVVLGVRRGAIGLL